MGSDICAVYIWSDIAFCAIMLACWERCPQNWGFPRKGGRKVSEEKPRTTEAQKRAKRKYMEKFVEVKVRMTPERRSAVQAHAEAQGESTTGFINRAISETMERDKEAI